jgi:hypothetical protein
VVQAICSGTAKPFVNKIDFRNVLPLNVTADTGDHGVMRIGGNRFLGGINQYETSSKGFPVAIDSLKWIARIWTVPQRD